MNVLKDYIALFDLDGVVIDTESQYSSFWDEQGLKYLNIPNYCSMIKGQTLAQIVDAYFYGKTSLVNKITEDLNDFESNMTFNYIPGADSFINNIRSFGIRTGLATSSNNFKMDRAYQSQPGLKELFDVIVTADMIEHSKPNPECFLKGMDLLHSDSNHTFIFEDSFHGLEAAKASGAIVIGLATTNSRETIIDKADYVIDNFVGKDADWLNEIVLHKL